MGDNDVDMGMEEQQPVSHQTRKSCKKALFSLFPSLLFSSLLFSSLLFSSFLSLLQSVWESKDEITQDTIEVSQEEYQAQFDAAMEQQQAMANNNNNNNNNQEEEEIGGFEEQTTILRLPAQSQPTMQQLLEKLQINGNINQCLDISAKNFNSFNTTAHGLCAAFGSDAWTRDDLDELTAARLFCNFPLIVIRDIDARLE